MIGELCRNVIGNLLTQRDDAIKKRLEERGIDVDSPDFRHEAKDRCCIRVKGDLHTLYLDKEPVCEWWETITSNVSLEGFGQRIIINITLGEIPSK